VREKALEIGVRPLRPHEARQTFASLALSSGKSILRAAGPLGRALVYEPCTERSIQSTIPLEMMSMGVRSVLYTAS